ncbi:MAG: ASCH domain-containing protein [Armatimonadetes bacterium]|nr:ASCH domain-containing protein [Armatimonadota bacterium]
MDIKLCSVRQPWAWALIHGGKDVENRSWSTNYRGLLAIHAGKQPHATLKHNAWKRFEQEYYGRDVFSGFDDESEPRGAIIGLVEMYGCEPGHLVDSIWRDEEPGWFAWRVRYPMPLPEPIPYKGQLGLRDIEEPLRSVLLELWATRTGA